MPWEAQRALPELLERLVDPQVLPEPPRTLEELLEALAEALEGLRAEELPELGERRQTRATNANVTSQPTPSPSAGAATGFVSAQRSAAQTVS